MRAKLTMCVGLPGSGKTTWALQQSGTTRVNQDDIRKELGWTSWADWDFNGLNEARTHVLKVQRIEAGLLLGHHVISDDTNLGRKRKVTMEQLARDNGADFEIKDFTKLSIDECIRRDGLRKEHARVGERVIRKMAAAHGLDISNDPAFAYTRFAPVGTHQGADNRAMALICDLDGTLALFQEKGHRGPYDASRCAEDEMNEPVQRLIQFYCYQYYQIIFLSGREEKYREPTMNFLNEKALISTWPRQPLLFMRPTGDKRKDWIVKGELFDAHIRGKYYIDFVLDDRQQVVDFWRHIGLTCFQVAKGDF